jgi:hypothetical protein
MIVWKHDTWRIYEIRNDKQVVPNRNTAKIPARRGRRSGKES